MAFAANFDKTMKKVLDERAPAYEWTRGWSPDGERWRVDLAGRPRKGDRRLVLIEVELKRDGPLGNVVKVWRWASKRRSAPHGLFIHAFSDHFSRSMRTHYERARFVGERMAADPRAKVKYETILFPFRPVKGRGRRIKVGGGAMRKAARDLAKRMARLIKSF